MMKGLAAKAFQNLSRTWLSMAGLLLIVNQATLPDAGMFPDAARGSARLRTRQTAGF
jgi:hypothetical protein